MKYTKEQRENLKKKIIDIKALIVKIKAKGYRQPVSFSKGLEAYKRFNSKAEGLGLPLLKYDKYDRAIEKENRDKMVVNVLLGNELTGEREKRESENDKNKK